MKKILRNNLVVLHTNMAVLRQLVAFRSDLFVAPAAFISLFGHNLFQYSVIIANRLWEDGKGLTLRRFKNSVVKAIKQEFRDALLERLRQIKLSPEIRDSLSRINEVRHKQYAHIDLGVHFSPDYAIPGIKLSDLERAAQFFASLCKALTFPGTDTRFVSIEFDPDHGELRHVLDLIAADSKVVKMFDTYPEAWERLYRQRLTADDIAAVNEVRKRLRLPEIV